jgi:hypothetical protein
VFEPVEASEWAPEVEAEGVGNCPADGLDAFASELVVGLGLPQLNQSAPGICGPLLQPVRAAIAKQQVKTPAHDHRSDSVRMALMPSRTI